MPKVNKRNTQHPFCPTKPADYWIDYRMDGHESWHRAKPVTKADKHKRPLTIKYDYDQETIIVHAANAKDTVGKYAIVFSPNNWEDWIRFPVIICAVQDPRKMFAPDEYNLTFRPDSTWRRYDINPWPVIGGSEIYKCGTVKIKLSFEDERFKGGWLAYY